MKHNRFIEVQQAAVCVGPTVTKSITRSIVVTVLLLLGGCQLTPNWGPQGTIGAQRNAANLHDPFPDNDLGPPIVGGRPLGFEQPRSETTQLQDSPFARRGARGGFVTPYQGF